MYYYIVHVFCFTYANFSQKQKDRSHAVISLGVANLIHPFSAGMSAAICLFSVLFSKYKKAYTCINKELYISMDFLWNWDFHQPI